MLDDMTGFARQVTLARQGLGDLNTLFKLNGQSVKDTQDAFFKVADLVKNARTDIEKFSILQSAGLPATREYVKLMEQGGAALREQAANAPKIDENTIRKAQELEKAFNNLKEIVSNFLKRDFVEFGENVERLAARFNLLGMAAKNALGGSISPFDYSFNRLTSYNDTKNDALRSGLLKLGQSRLNSSTGGQGGANNKPTVTADDLASRQKINSLQQQYLGLLGQTATVEQQVLAVRLQIQANQMNPDAIRLTKEQIANLERLARERALGTDQMKAQTDAYNVEAAAIGMSVGAAAEYTAVYTKLNEAKRLGIELSPQEIESIKSSASAMGEAAQRADNLRFGYDTFSGTMREFGSNIRSGQTAMEAFGNAGVNALGKIADRLMDMASRQLWNAAFPNGGGGLFSWITGSTGGAGDFIGNPWSAGSTVPIIGHTGGMGYELGSSGRYVHPAYFDDAPRFHQGKLPWGPDEMPAIIRPNEAVLTPGQLRAVAGAGASPSISLVVNNNNDFRGVDPSMRAFIVAQQRVQGEQTKREVMAEVAKMNKNAPGYIRKV